MASFLITIDTEGDNIWSRPRAVTTRNAEYLTRFQTLCEKYGWKPTYLTNFEMATSSTFQQLGREVLRRETGEMGMHLHAWDTPPLVPLTADDTTHHPYLIEYSASVMREKIKVMTETLEEVFGVKMRSHRAGRWAFNETYAQFLIEHGYWVDCSVTPHVSWKDNKGDPQQTGGSDYTHFPERSYFLDPTNIRCPGNSPLLEVPMTIRPRPGAALLRAFQACAITRGFFRKISPVGWLRPNGRNLEEMLRLARKGASAHAMFMIHSSELMPGGSRLFPTAESIDGLYGQIEALFASLRNEFQPATLQEYYHKMVNPPAP